MSATVAAPAPRIGRLAAADAPVYRALMMRAYAEEPDAYTTTAEERAAEPDDWWVRRIAAPDGRAVAYGAWQGDELVGAAALEFSRKPRTAHDALLLGMYVRPESRGQGAAQALVQACIDHCAARGGIRHLKLTVTDGNAAAIRLYESAGFATWGVEPGAILVAAGLRAKRHMWRPVAA